jgi:hypothetical protein
MSTLVHRQAQFSIEINISASPLRRRNVRWIVCEQAMDEVLLGRLVLHSLRIDAESHLDAARESLQDLDSSSIISDDPIGRLSRLLMRRADKPRQHPDSMASTPDDAVSSVSEDFKKVTHGESNLAPIFNSRPLDIPSELPD